MRHIYGKPYHRNTESNQRKAQRAGDEIGKAQLGLEMYYSPRDRSFIKFVAACVTVWNKDRGDGQHSIRYGEIFSYGLQPKKIEVDGHWQENPEYIPYLQRDYPPYPEATWKELRESGFPPMMLAIACWRIMQLNLHDKSPGAKAKQLDKVQQLEANDAKRRAMIAEKEQAKLEGVPDKRNLPERAMQAAIQLDKDHLAGRPSGQPPPPSRGRMICYQEVREGFNPDDIPDSFNSHDHAAMIDARNDWKEPGEAEAEPPRETIPAIVKGQAAKVHKIEFLGGWKISRRMNCYYRGTFKGKPTPATLARRKEFERCVLFVLSLLEKPWPEAPAEDGWASTAPMAALLLERDLNRLKAQRMARHPPPTAAAKAPKRKPSRR